MTPSNKSPFFARFLETAARPASGSRVRTGLNAGRTLKYPSDIDEDVITLKYPSDGDEGGYGS